LPLVSTDRSVTVAALIWGFRSISTFARSF
jgi:hypothetical protein